MKSRSPSIDFIDHKYIGFYLAIVLKNLNKISNYIFSSKHNEHIHRAFFYIEKAIVELNKARSEMEAALFSENQDQTEFNPRIYYPLTLPEGILSKFLKKRRSQN